MLQHLCMDHDMAKVLRLPQGKTHELIPCACASDGNAPSTAANAANIVHPSPTHGWRNTKATVSHLFNCQHDQAFVSRHTALMDVVYEAAVDAGLHPVKELPVSKPKVRIGEHNQKLPAPRFDVSISSITPSAKVIQSDVTVCSHRRPEYREGAAATSRALPSRQPARPPNPPGPAAH